MRISILFSFLAVSACGGSGSSGPEPTGENVITPAGVTLVLANGAVTIEAPAGAVTQNVSVEASVRASGGPVDPTVVRGAEYVIATTPTVTFAKPVRITVAYDPANAPIGVHEKELGVAVIDGTEWKNVGPATIDETANKVTASITKPGIFTVQRAPQTSSCASAEHRQFDFWLGEWDVTGIHSSVTRDNSGCTIFELYRAPNTGRSISFYDPETAKWYQTYVSPAGQPLKMSGGIENGRMVMYVRVANGTVTQRWTWERLDDNRVTQRAEITPDNGTTWNQGFFGTYIRR